METLDIIPSLELQLAEVEMLRSMYPDESEFSITIPSVIADMNNFISGKSRHLPNHLDYNINLLIPDINEKIEINVNLPHEYPIFTTNPSISVRSASLNRAQQKKLNLAISDLISSQCEGELVIVSLATWLTDNASKFFLTQTQSNMSENQEACDNVYEMFCRMWIYSHHIYNKFKRRGIVESAHDLRLTGFSLPGKPGIICIEGLKNECDDFFQQLKHMSWKKLSLIKEETDIMSAEVPVDALRKFDSFSEISFHTRQGPAREYHMDMAQFLQFLEDHNCAYAFQDLFGLEGHFANDKKLT